MGLNIDFGPRLCFLGHILGSIKWLGSTHSVDNFGIDLISCHQDRGGWNEIGCLHGVLCNLQKKKKQKTKKEGVRVPFVLLFY